MGIQSEKWVGRFRPSEDVAERTCTNLDNAACYTPVRTLQSVRTQTEVVQPTAVVVCAELRHRWPRSRLVHASIPTDT